MRGADESIMIRIPKFPTFKKLEIEDKEEIEDYVKKFAPYSDYNFTSIWAYNVEDDIIVSQLNNNLVVRFRDYITNDPFYSFIGKNKISDTIDQLLKFSVHNKLPPILKLIPEDVIRSEDHLDDLYDIKEDVDNADYIVQTEDLAKLEGGKYEHKRWRVKKFIKNFPGYNFTELDLQKKDIQAQIFILFEEWEKEKAKSREDTGHELIALQRLLAQAHKLKLVGIGVYHEGHMIGYIISEIVHDRHIVGHFMKANPRFTGVTEALYNYNAQHIAKKNVAHINMEQDLGIEGLRESKLSWRPHHYLKKYIISKK